VLLTVAFIATGVYGLVLIALGIRNKWHGLSSAKAIAAMAATLAAGLAVLWLFAVGSRTKHHAAVHRLQLVTAAAELAYWRSHHHFTAAVRLDLEPLSAELRSMLHDDPTADVRVPEVAGDGQSAIVRTTIGGDLVERIIRAPRARK
jgi:hypothetical protein